MLIASPTKSGTGLFIFGDYGDLSSLYKTVYEEANPLDEVSIRSKGQNQLLMNFAYEIRKAYSFYRLNDKMKFSGDSHELQYYGFKLIWTDILIFISVLRYNAGYIQLNRREQANMYLLEHAVESALFEYDPEGANAIQHLIGQRINISNPFVFINYQALHI